MRGDTDRQAEIMLALTPDQLVPEDHPIRRIKPIAEAVLARLSPRFDAMYAEGGRPSIPPEHLLKSLLLIALYSIRSERQFCERLRYDLLFKWFLARIHRCIERECAGARVAARGREVRCCAAIG